MTGTAASGHHCRAGAPDSKGKEAPWTLDTLPGEMSDQHLDKRVGSCEGDSRGRAPHGSDSLMLTPTPGQFTHTARALGTTGPFLQGNTPGAPNLSPTHGAFAGAN